MVSYRYSAAVLSLLTLACTAAGTDTGETDIGTGGSSEASSSDPAASSATAEQTSTTQPASGPTTEPATSSSASGSASTATGSSDGTATDTGDASSSGGSGEPPPDPRDAGPYPTMRSQATAPSVLGASIPLEVVVPAGLEPIGVAVLTHGFALGPSNYASYGEHLASWGVAVVLPQLPGSILDAPSHAEQRDRLVEVLDWIGTASQGGGVLAGVDPNAVLMAGHSMGGKLSLLTAVTDARVAAVFGLDPVDSAGGPGVMPGPENPSVTPELMPLVVVPVGLVGETTNATGGLGGACAPEAENFAQYFLHVASPAIEIEFLGANHMSFLDDANCGLTCSVCPAGTDTPALTRDAARGFLAAFALRYLGGDEGYRYWLAGEGAQVDEMAGLIALETANGF